MFNYRKFAGKAWLVITNVGTIFSVASFSWNSAFTVVVALTSVVWATAIAVWAVMIGSMPAWVFPTFGLIGISVLTGLTMFLVKEKVAYVASQYKQLEHDNQDLHQALKDTTGEVNAVNSDRAAALEDLETCRKRFAYSKLSWIAERELLNGELLNGGAGAVINVDVRFATHDDRLLAAKIQDIIEHHMGWPVTLNGDLTIKPNNEFKVSFVSDLRKTFDEIAEAFKSGNLLHDVSVEVSHNGLLEDRHRLVVEVSPTVLGVKETIS